MNSVFPPVSCCMPTYGRSVEVLNESVQSFLDQDYPGDKELVIYNDHEGIEFVFDHPEVRIVNSKMREASLGEKYNKTVGFAKYDYIVLWDDDDIYLPHRLSYSMENMVDGFFVATRYLIYYEQTKELVLSTSTPAASLCADKKEFFLQGGYEHKEKGADLKMAVHAANLFKNKPKMSCRDIFYVLKWAPQTRYHHSAVTRSRDDETARSFIDTRISEDLLGVFEICPGYKMDYKRLVDEFVASLDVCSEAGGK